jgi:hypothetical protein
VKAAEGGAGLATVALMRGDGQGTKDEGQRTKDKGQGKGQRPMAKGRAV